MGKEKIFKNVEEAVQYFGFKDTNLEEFVESFPDYTCLIQLGENEPRVRNILFEDKSPYMREVDVSKVRDKLNEIYPSPKYNTSLCLRKYGFEITITEN